MSDEFIITFRTLPVICERLSQNQPKQRLCNDKFMILCIEMFNDLIKRPKLFGSFVYARFVF